MQNSIEGVAKQRKKKKDLQALGAVARSQGLFKLRYVAPTSGPLVVYMKNMYAFA